MDWVDKPQNYKDLYGILQLLRGCHLNNFPLKTLKLRWVAFHLVTFQFTCLDFQSNQYKKLVPVLSRFCNWLCKLMCNCASIQTLHSSVPLCFLAMFFHKIVLQHWACLDKNTPKSQLSKVDWDENSRSSFSFSERNILNSVHANPVGWSVSIKELEKGGFLEITNKYRSF